MADLYVDRKTLYELMYDAMVKAVTILPSDIKARFLELIASERNETARLNMELTLKNCVSLNEGGNRLLCPDTGSPLYYVRVGPNVKVEGGFSSFREEAKRAVSAATKDTRLRPNMVHPITRQNTGTNVGYYMPRVDFLFDADIDYLDVIAVPNSGGSEVSGTFYRMMSPVDGKKGIMKFILDCIKNSTYAGTTCPPNVIGIGIGGTADVCMKLAKEAAVLRPIGSRHPDKDMAELELELIEFINSSGVGPMGMGGSSGVLDVHIEYAVTHAAGLPVAYNAQCWLGRRKVARIRPGGEITYSDLPEWTYR